MRNVFLKFAFFLWAIPCFAVFNLTWGAPAVSLDSNPPLGDTDSNARIAIDPAGNAIAAWSRTVGRQASEDVWAAFYNHSLRIWTGAIKISGGGSADKPQVAIDQLGNATIVWEEGFPTQIMYRTLSYDGIWEPNLSDPPAFVNKSKNPQTTPQIQTSGSGDIHTIWMEYAQGTTHIFAAFKPFEKPWEHFGIISDGLQNAILASSKSLAVNPLGEAIVVWQELTPNACGIRGSLYRNGIWNPPMAICVEEREKANFPTAAIDVQGNAVILWEKGNIIYSKTLRDGYLSPVPLVISNPMYPSTHPDVGVDGKGNCIAVFERCDTRHKFISGATFNSSSNTWSPAVDISGPSLAEITSAGYPVLSVNTIGDGVVIWKEHTGENMVIQGAGYSLGTWSNTRTLSSLEADSGGPTSTYDIAVALNEAGNILAIWPEDPRKMGTSQIKSTAGVGLANVGPPPPLAEPKTIENPGGVIFGYQEIHRFPAHADIINILTWTCAGQVSHFNIYRNSLSNLIGTTTEMRYEDHRQKPKNRVTYLITCVDANGQESSPMTIVVEPL